MAAEADDLDALDEKVIQINRNTISKNSRAVYDSKKVHFIRWLDRNKQDLLSEEFLGAAERDAQGELKKAYIKAVIDGFDQGQPAPVRLAELTAKDIQLFVASLKKRDGTDVGTSVHSTTRSAIKDLFRSYEVVISKQIETALETFFKGLKKTTAAAKGRGVGKVQTGKRPMEFSLLCFLAERLLQSGHTDDIFAHCYLLLSWNLMCRSANTKSICFSHLQWFNDSLGIFFAHMKNDQAGERPMDARHVYANPLKPAICPILSLAIYFACFSIAPAATFIFPGASQNER